MAVVADGLSATSDWATEKVYDTAGWFGASIVGLEELNDGSLYDGIEGSQQAACVVIWHNS